jgi:hypothetical protein
MMPSDTPTDKLLALATRLQGLLSDPQPGYFTWHEAVHQTTTEIGAFAGMAPARPERETALAKLADEWADWSEYDGHAPMYFASKLRAVLAMER